VIADALIRPEDLPAREPGRLGLVLDARTHPKSMSHRSFPLAS
jgi:hypothetical protein